MKNFGLTSLSELLDDFVVFRNLKPLDSRLPDFETTKQEIKLSQNSFPRKTQTDYARVINHILIHAQRIRLPQAPDTPILRIIYLGDTLLNDGSAFANICNTGSKSGAAFIGSQSDKPQDIRITEKDGHPLFQANRWNALKDFEAYLKQHNITIDEQTAIMIDLDKTSIGARGRNDKIIDRIRLEAAYETLQVLLGELFDTQAFEEVYHFYNQPEFHTFTTDNQDYLVYLCLMLGTGLFKKDTLASQIRAGEIGSFQTFTNLVDQRKKQLSPSLQETHANFTNHMKENDPTPFKTFRQHEYRFMCRYMGQLPPTTPVEDLLQNEVTITQEIRQIARSWKEKGALLFGISDKPDEASIPSLQDEKQGFKPIHKIPTHAVGEE